MQVEGLPVEAMIDSGSSATVMSFALFEKVGQSAGIPNEVLEVQEVMLRDYNGQPILIGAQVNLMFQCNGESVAAPVYIRSSASQAGEPCLLGTNVLAPLGLISPGPGVEVRWSADRPRRNTTDRKPSGSVV